MQTLITIYGAQMVAVSVYYAIKELYSECRIQCFLVKEQAGNPYAIDGIPVLTLDRYRETHIKVLIATPENHHPAIIRDLEAKGIKDHLCMDSQKEAALMERYYEKKGYRILHAYPAGSSRAGLSIFMSKFYRDQPLKGNYQTPDWIYPIQAGAALTDIRIARLCDNHGDNISEKNGNYSELSALYWVGKHADGDYIGLFHYRRILDVQEEDLYRIKENDIDVILPFPTIHYPSINEHHKRYLKEQDWEAMVEALAECAPPYARALPQIFTGQYFYNYNMLVAKKQIFQDFCNWMYPILARTEELSEPKGWERSDRYIGYLGENLTALYFLYHQNDFHIAHTGRRMLV